jgi:hypothetical protein
MMVDTRLVDGNEIEPILEKMLAPSNVDCPHIHFCGSWLLCCESGES